MDNSLFRSSGTCSESTRLNQYRSKLSHVPLLALESYVSPYFWGALYELKIPSASPTAGANIILNHP